MANRCDWIASIHAYANVPHWICNSFTHFLTKCFVLITFSPFLCHRHHINQSDADRCSVTGKKNSLAEISAESFSCRIYYSFIWFSNQKWAAMEHICLCLSEKNLRFTLSNLVMKRCWTEWVNPVFYTGAGAATLKFDEGHTACKSPSFIFPYIIIWFFEHHCWHGIHTNMSKGIQQYYQ